MQAAKANVHAVYIFGFFLSEGFFHTLVEEAEDGSRVAFTFDVDDFVEQSMANHTHKSAGYAVAGTVHHGHKSIIEAAAPEEIARNNVFGLVNDKEVFKNFLHSFFRRQDGLLHSLGVLEAVGELLVEAEHLLGVFVHGLLRGFHGIVYGE